MSTTTITEEAPALVAPEPEHCPGPTSALAGTAPSCAGCPNQSICATATPSGPDPDIPAIAATLAQIKHKLLIMSGKGGVGKSTLTTLLAHAFAHAAETAGSHDATGMMDIDITGPSLPTLTGCVGEQIHTSADGWAPVWVRDNLALMSIQFLLPNKDDAIIWRGAKKTGMIKRFLRDVAWGELEYLLVDTPPGTSDEHLSILSLLKESSAMSSPNGGKTAAIIVTTPQELALLDVRKQIGFCRKAGLPILGLVENMAGFVCPNCTKSSEIFKATTGGGEALAKEMGVRFLGRVPLDPRVGAAGDFGESVMDAYPDSPAVAALEGIVKTVTEVLAGDGF